MIRLRPHRTRLLLVAIVLLAAAVVLPAPVSIAGYAQQQPLTNDSILLMSKSKMGDDLIIQTINASPGGYKTAPEDLVALKAAGLSDRVIGAMIAKGIPAASGPLEPIQATADDFAGVDDIGVYYKGRGGKWVPMPPELMNTRSGGVLKSFASNGMVREDTNGFIYGKAAQLSLTRQTEVLLHAPEGAAPQEFQLLKLRVKSTSREFRTQTGGFLSTTSGAQRDLVRFQPTKVAPHLYQFVLPPDMPKGEYGIVPPGSMSGGNVVSGGKIYTFNILE
jgi:hypothetical protein